MPPNNAAACKRLPAPGRVIFQTELVLRFNYGGSVPWVNRLDDGTINAIAGPERLGFADAGLTYGEDLKTVGEFWVNCSDSILHRKVMRSFSSLLSLTQSQ